MSIISEALRKAHQSKQGKLEEAKQPKKMKPPDFERTSLKLRGRVSWPGLVAAGAAILVAGFLFRGLLAVPSGFRKAFPWADAGSAQYAVEEKPAILAPSMPKPRARAPRPFSLSGIAQFQDSYMAVLNGKIVRAGDKIDGAEVLAINSKAVELEYRGERVVLEKTF